MLIEDTRIEEPRLKTPDERLATSPLVRSEKRSEVRSEDIRCDALTIRDGANMTNEYRMDTMRIPVE